MNSTPTLATRFARNTRVLRADVPLIEDQMRATAPSVFAESKHASRSERYTYIPTIDVLRGLKREGFEPFMVAQGASRVEGKTAYTKHLVRLRHGRDVAASAEVNEIILIKSHDGASSYQLLAGRFRRVCQNGLVVGDVVDDIRIPHRGNVHNDVIEGAFRVLDQFETVDEHAAAMKALSLEPREQIAFATAALALRFGERSVEESGGHAPAPVTAEQLNEPRRVEDAGSSLWATLQRIQEHVTKGGLVGRTAQGRRIRTRPIASIDRGVSLNRALWRLAEEMRQIKAAT